MCCECGGALRQAITARFVKEGVLKKKRAITGKDVKEGVPKKKIPKESL